MKRISKKIVYIIPGLAVSGGIAVILKHANLLREKEYDVTVINCGKNVENDWFHCVAPIVWWDISSGAKCPVANIDIAIATHFSTAKIVKNKLDAKRKIYFVQSDERRFGLERESFLECQNSYKMKLEYMTEAVWIQRWLKEEFDHDAYFVPNGLDEKIFFQTDPIQKKKEKTRILLEGPIDVPFKGMMDAYNAVKDLDCELWIVSSNGKPKKDWKYDRFFENVPMDKMREIYSSCDIFLKMSRVEGFFGPPLEAMACGCAVVVGKCTGYDEYIIGGENALVVEQGDVETAKKAVQALIDDLELRNRLIENGRKTFQQWSWDRSIDFLEKVVRGDEPVVHYASDKPEKYDYFREMGKILWGVLAEAEKKIDGMDQLKEVSAGLQKSISQMESSKFWKARELYLGCKFAIFSPGKFITKYYKRVFEEKKDILHNHQEYAKWIRKNEKWDSNGIKIEIEKFKYKPKISIITPVYNVELRWLNKCIQSVVEQLYENWELCLYDDASTNTETIECLKKWENKDARIKIVFGKENKHISGASNEALKIATGEFVALLDNDDELSPNALYENVKLLNGNPEADFIYSDEDKLQTDGTRVAPFFKPGWSLDFFLSMMYTCHLGVYRKSIIDEIGGFRQGYEGSQDYDLVLRFIEKTSEKNIFRIPKILYHWRMIEGSTATNTNTKNYSVMAARKALTDYLERNRINGEVVEGTSVGSHQIKRDITSENGIVSIIISSDGGANILRRCIESIVKKNTYDNFEIIVVDNANKQSDKDYLDEIAREDKIRVLPYGKSQKLGRASNYAASLAKGEYILFLDERCEILTEQWIESMLGCMQGKNIGIVGTKILYPNNSIYYAGILLAAEDVATYIFRGDTPRDSGYFGMGDVRRNYSAVSGKCLLIRKKLFTAIDGFTEKEFLNNFADIDLCLKAQEKGYLAIYDPFVQLYWHDLPNAGGDDSLNGVGAESKKRERNYMHKKWAKYMQNDSCSNPNLAKVKI